MQKTNKQKNQNTFPRRTRNSQEVSEEKATHQKAKQLYEGEENKDIQCNLVKKAEIII